MKIILVTGGAGLIGSALCKRLLEEGNKVVTVDNFSVGTEDALSDIIDHKNFRIEKADLVDSDKIEKILIANHFDIIYHLASNTSIPKGQNDIEVDLKNTFLITITILRLAAKYNIKQFVFASSSTIYGKSDSAFDEKTPMHPISYYGAAKMSCEAFINAFCPRYGIKTWIIRFSNVVGPNTTHGIVKDIKKMINCKLAVLHLLGDGMQEKPFLYIDDAIEGLLFVVKHASDELKTYLIGNRETITVRRIAEIALEEAQYDAQILFDNAPSWPGDVQKYKYDISKATLLGWQPIHNSEQAIRKSFNYSK